MKIRILAAALFCFWTVTPVWSETVRIAKADCRRLVEHSAAPDVTFKPGIDVRGKKVAPAGGPAEPANGKLVPKKIEFSIALNPLRGGGARFGETSLGAATVRFDMKTRRATLNGQELTRKCRKFLRKSKSIHRRAPWTSAGAIPKFTIRLPAENP